MTNFDPHNLKRYIRTIHDYPKPGIEFRDITTLVRDPVGLRRAVDLLLQPFTGKSIDCVAAIEARGFIIGGALSYHLGCGFVPIRKAGKLPGDTIGQDYQLEYGTDRVEIHKDAIHEGMRVLIIDDLLATGGTAAAAIDLVQQAGGEIIAAGFIIDLPDLGGREKLGQKNIDVHTLVAFEGE